MSFVYSQYGLKTHKARSFAGYKQVNQQGSEEDLFSSSFDNTSEEDGLMPKTLAQRAGSHLSSAFTGLKVSVAFMTLVAAAMVFSSFPHSPTSPQTGSSYQSISSDLSSYSSLTRPSKELCRAMRSRIVTGPLQYQSAAGSDELPAVGKVDLFQENGQDTCITYEARYSRYTDEALGMTYRYNRSELSNVDQSIEFVRMQGPTKPNDMDAAKWEEWQKERMTIVNSNLTTEMQSEMIDWRALMDNCGLDKVPTRPKKKTVVLFRIYKGYVMTEDNILNLRALLTELSISQPEKGYDVRVAVNVPDDSGVYTSRLAQERILTPMLPREFWPLVSFWSREEVHLAYPMGSNDPGYYGANLDCLGSDQLFAARHPEYDFIYHWEADARFFGDYRTFIKSSEEFATAEPTSPDLLKYGHHFIANSNKSAKLWSDEDGLPGRGEEPDLITFNPMFDAKETQWLHYGWNKNFGVDSPRLASAVAFIRVSARMHRAWGKAAVEHQKHLHCESWPSTFAKHSHLPLSPNNAFHPEDKARVPLKAVFVPHPLYFSEKHNVTDLEDGLLIPNLYHQSKEGYLFSSTYHPIAYYAKESYMEWRAGHGRNACVRPHMVHPVKQVGY